MVVDYEVEVRQTILDGFSEGENSGDGEAGDSAEGEVT